MVSTLSSICIDIEKAVQYNAANFKKMKILFIILDSDTGLI